MQEVRKKYEVGRTPAINRFKVEAVRKKELKFIILYIIRLHDMKTYVRKCTTKEQLITASQIALKNLGFAGLVCEDDITWRWAYDWNEQSEPAPEEIDDITV